MTEIRTRSQQNSPVPRRELGSLSVNQRSYSRVGSSKSIFGDESPLMSPLPYYPRRRSVTFAGAEEGREERPQYNAMHPASAPVSPVRRQSPPPAGILKKSIANGSRAAEEEGARPNANGEFPQEEAALPQAHSPAARSSPVPRRGRSASRQRLTARRREAQLHHSFYDDSFVEEFVLSSKEQLAKDEEARRLEAQMQAEKEKAHRAELRLNNATDKFNALQHAKEVLMAAAQRRRSSTPTPSPVRATAAKEGQTHANANRDGDAPEMDFLRSLEEDPNPEIQAALAKLAEESVMASKTRHNRKPSRRRRSMPIVSDSLNDSTDSEDGQDGIDSERLRQRKRAKLEKIVSSILSQEKNRGKSKRSVVVINWSDEESEGDPLAAVSQATEDEDLLPRRQRSRRAATKSRSVALTTGVTSVPSRAGRKAASSRRAPSSRKRAVSAVPELDDSLLLENDMDQPVLLPRRTQRRPQPTRSLSALDAAADDALLDETPAPPQRAPRRAARGPRGPRGNGAPRAQDAPVDEAEASYSRNAAPRTASRQPLSGVPPARRRHAAAAQSAATAPRMSPDDPMAVFFEAAFPSPSKFDELMQQAGGLPESRRGTGNRGRQPNLVLPTSIGRRR